MNNIEKLLSKSKEELDNLDIPIDIESRLRNSLNNIPNKRKKINNKARAAALILAVLLIGYNVDTLAYYGKQLIGYENVMNGTLRQLNDLGKGQIIDKSYTFKNGVKVILDGIILDDNKLIAFYTINDPSGNVQNAIGMSSLEGKFGNSYNNGGHGQANDDGTEMKWVISCDKPKFFEKKMKLEIYSNDFNEIGAIEFKLDRNKALGNSFKMAINKKVELDKRQIKIKSLVASPTTTVIKGQIQNILELGIDEIKGERFMPENIELALLANGVEIEVQQSGMSTNMKGSQFDVTYDALSPDTKEIEIKLLTFGGNHEVKEIIELTKGDINKTIKVLEQDIKINEVYEAQGNTYINITTDEDLTLSKVFLNIDGNKIQPQKTIPGDYTKIVEEDNLMIKNTRTIEFKGTGGELKLDIQRIRYKKNYNDIIYSYILQ